MELKRSSGGEGGIRTLGTVLPVQPLSRRLPSAGSATSPLFGSVRVLASWRREQDLNLRSIAAQRFSRPPPSAARPSLPEPSIYTGFHPRMGQKKRDPRQAMDAPLILGYAGGGHSSPWAAATLLSTGTSLRPPRRSATEAMGIRKSLHRSRKPRPHALRRTPKRGLPGRGPMPRAGVAARDGGARGMESQRRHGCLSKTSPGKGAPAWR